MEMFKENLERIMREKGLNKSALSQKAGLETSAVRQILSDRVQSPRLNNVIAIANALECSLDELAGRPIVQLAGTDTNMSYVNLFDVQASAGMGTMVDSENIIGRVAFPTDWLKAITRAGMDKLAVITVRGDSMYPTLSENDHVLVDLTQRHIQADGIYIIRQNDVVQIKRLTVHPVHGTVTVKSDNQYYEDYHDITPTDLTVVGKVVWIGRKI